MPQTGFGKIYQIGDMLRLQVSFTDADGAAVDPTTVTLTVLEPDANETSYTYGAAEVEKESTGVYYYDLTVDQAGIHFFRWSAGGAYVAVDEGSFKVSKSNFA
jgi:hypothetical protein